MLKIIFIIALEVVSFIAFQYAQQLVRTSEQISFSANNDLAGQKNERSKEFFPLFFGSGFFFIDERQVCFE